jgi:hypothetical protein
MRNRSWGGEALLCREYLYYMSGVVLWNKQNCTHSGLGELYYPVSHNYTILRERVLFIGTRFSILYTSIYYPVSHNYTILSLLE